MSDPLATYLHDHLAGSRAAVHILKTMRRTTANEEVARFAGALLEDVEADRELLSELSTSISDRTNAPKEALAWLGEKMTHVKLRYRLDGATSVVMALEMLGTGIQGKMMLWRTLAELRPDDGRLSNLNFDRLLERAQVQFDEIESFRLELVRRALGPERRSQHESH